MNKGDLEKMVIENGKMLSKLNEKTDTIMDEIRDIKQALDIKYVQKTEFMPVRNISYGLVAGTLMTILGFMLTHVFG